MNASNIDTKTKLPYNPKSVQSILEYGEKLLGHSLRELHPDAKIFKGKGGLGDSVEYYHYGYEPNSKPEPDFDSLCKLISDYGLEPVNKVYNGGALWFEGTRGDETLKDFASDCSDIGCSLQFAKDARALKHKRDGIWR